MQTTPLSPSSTSKTDQNSFFPTLFPNSVINKIPSFNSENYPDMSNKNNPTEASSQDTLTTQSFNETSTINNLNNLRTNIPTINSFFNNTKTVPFSTNSPALSNDFESNSTKANQSIIAPNIETTNDFPEINIEVPSIYSHEESLNNISKTKNMSIENIKNTTSPHLFVTNTSNEQTIPFLFNISTKTQATNLPKNDTFNYRTGKKINTINLPLSGYEYKVTEKKDHGFNPLHLALALILIAISSLIMAWFVYWARKSKRKSRRSSQVDPRYKYVIRVKHVQPINS